MNRDTIKQRVAGLQSKEDLLCLLNDLKTEDLGHDRFAFTIRQLNYYCNPNYTRGRYTSFDIKKKSGGARHIDAPSCIISTRYFKRFILHPLQQWVLCKVNLL